MMVKARADRVRARRKERIRLSNEAEANGLPPDPWVVEYRAKNNATRKNWEAKKPKAAPKKREPHHTWFKKGNPDWRPKLTPEEKMAMEERRKAYKKQWEKENRERMNTLKRLKKQNDPSFKIACNLRSRLSGLLKKNIAKKVTKTLTLLGCDMSFFMGYLAGKFTEGMTFENYGRWHLDHIKPCDSFDLTDPKQQRECFHYTNFQPLWDIDNRRKSNKIEIGRAHV